MNSIHFPYDVKGLNISELQDLCHEVREYFIATILENGGHFSANLGVVELTVAMLKHFDLQKDKLIWDVGHQSYIYKMLTGRRAEIKSIRHKGGISGFPKPEESEYDHFGTGHSSTSVSAILGMAEAAVLDGVSRKHIAIIGDGSLTGGMSFEALNNLGRSKADVLVVVNDNKMGIDPSTGALTVHLNSIEGKHPNFFENLGLHYHGPVDGHNMQALITAFRELDLVEGPKVLHIKTIKGKGYEPAEKEQVRWHAVKYVKIDPDRESSPSGPRFQDVFGRTLLALAREDPGIVGVTPAMPSGSSMKIMQEVFPGRVFDVGIAEQHAVTFSAGLALSGKKVFCNIYSSFAQRAYDQIIHDVALQNIPVVFCLDRSGLVGEDGPTHHGAFDLAYLEPVPNLMVLAPMDQFELESMMRWACKQDSGPIVIRYPKGSCLVQKALSPSEEFRPEPRKLKVGAETAVLSIGEIGAEVLKLYKYKDLIFSHYDLRISKSLEINHLRHILNSHPRIITLEDGVLSGGVGEKIKAMAQTYGYTGEVNCMGIPDAFIAHGTVEELRSALKMDAEALKTLLRS